MKQIIFDFIRFYTAKRRKLTWAFNAYLADRIKLEKAQFFSYYKIRENKNLENGIVVGEFQKKKFIMQCKINDEIEGRMLIDKIWDRSLIELIAALIERKQGTVIDIGANVGAITIPLAVAFSNRKFYCFEPHPHIIKRLEKNIKMNYLTNITTMQKAVSDAGGVVSFFAQTESDNMGLSSMLKESVNVNNEKITVDCTTLNAFVKDNNLTDIALIKIDVQGAEINVLRGMNEILKTNRPILVFEHEDYLHGIEAIQIRSEIDSIFKTNDYKLYNVSSILLEEYGFAHNIDLTNPFEGNILALPE